MRKRNLDWKSMSLVGFGIVVALGITGLCLALSPSLDLWDSLRIVYGSVFVLFLPGFVWSYVFFPFKRNSEDEAKGGIDWLERIALSFALSIALVPLVVFYLNLIGVKIGVVSAIIEILVLIGVGCGLAWWRIQPRQERYLDRDL